jgi:hypothetical protein
VKHKFPPHNDRPQIGKTKTQLDIHLGYWLRRADSSARARRFPQQSDGLS